MAKRWHNTEMTWEQFCSTQREPVRTKETEKEYKALPKAERDAVKDVGGFVGGYLREGQRKRGHCEKRSLLTLDADSPSADFLAICELFGYAACVFSTHSSTKTHPRYRLILPLSREVSSEEYTPLALKVAEYLGLENFDPTTYQAERLMYNSSCPVDAEYVWREDEGEWLDPDEWLGRYADWHDASAWPLPGLNAPRDAKKQGDPLSKPGVIGAFNRAYSIEDAISIFLPDVYTPSTEGRYTYAHGSTFGGLVTYDGLFAYSNHATDPASGKLCNAYDLVRLHMFGAQDEDSPVGTSLSKLPSTAAMRAFVATLDDVKQRVAIERMTEAAQDFGVTLEPADTEWTKQLTFNRAGDIESSAQNIEIIMQNDPAIHDLLRLDTFAQRAVLTDSTPWRKVTPTTTFWGDTDDAGLRVYLEKLYGISARAKVEDALMLELERHAVHPVREYLAGLEWDGVPRVETLLVDYLGAVDNEYTRCVTRKFLAATVARVMRPGCKFDHMLVFTGKQGIGKTFLAEKLAGKWFSNTLDTVQGKEAYEALQGVWIMEMGELTATKKADIEATKHFISKTEDAFRVAYGRRKSYFPRQCTFIGTTNEAAFLRDRTGNRRYWPVGVSSASESRVWDLTQDVVDQIWAEALGIYEAGETLYLNAEQELLATAEQELRLEDSGMDGIITDFLGVPITEDWYKRSIVDRRRYVEQYGDGSYTESGEVVRAQVCVLEVWCEALGRTPGSIKPINAAEIRAVLNCLPGWERYDGGDKGRLRFGRGYDRQSAWRRFDTLLD